MLGWLQRMIVAGALTLCPSVLAASIPAAPVLGQASGHVSSVKTVVLPAPSADGPGAVFVTIGDRPVLVQRGGATALRADDRGWDALDGRALGDIASIRGSASGGSETVVLTGLYQGIVDRVALIDIVGKSLELRKLPDLPRPLVSAVAAVDGEAIALVGVAADGTPVFLRLPLGDVDRNWTAEAAWPGRAAPVALVVQSGATYLTTTDHRQFRWTQKMGWQARTAAPGAVVRGAARPIGQANLLYEIEHAGGIELFTYSGITDAWAALGQRQAAGTLVTPYGNGFASLTATPRGWQAGSAVLEYQRRPLGWLDWTIVAIYLIGMLAIGFHFWKRSRMGSTSEFFLGSRAIPFWAAGVSMFAGNTSSISYLAVPAKAFDTDWQYMMSKIVTVFGLMAVAFWIIPLFRRLNLVSVFSYLETRFHPAIRVMSSALAILMHVGGRMGVVLLLPALAIGTITGTSVTLCIVVIGSCTILYTALGGMKAVIWTDFFQVVVLMGGALFAIGFMIHAVGATQIIETAQQFDKTRLLNTSFDFTGPTIWGFIILITFDTVLTFPKDQVLMQRALSTPSVRQASGSVWVFAAILLPGGLIFYLIGTTLFAYYRANPGRLDPLLPVDAVFPAFIGTELPHGVTGIIIAGLFAAAMGTLSGTINSVATLLSVDFYARLKRDKPTQQSSVRFAEWMTVLIGTIGILIAIVLSRLEIRSLLDLTIELFGLLGGSCAGSYTLGMFSTRANWQGVAIGIVAASTITLAAWLLHLVHPYFYLAIAIVTSIVVGYLASLLFPPPRAEQLRGMTVFTGGGRSGGRDGEIRVST